MSALRQLAFLEQRPVPPPPAPVQRLEQRPIPPPSAPVQKMHAKQPAGEKKPPRQESDLYYAFNAQLAEVPAIRDLEDMYVVENRQSVSSFLESHRHLKNLLLRAEDPLNTSFGASAIKLLKMVYDDEGSETLYCLVLNSGALEDAMRSLREFDERWWAAKYQTAAGKLNFDFELV